MAGVKILCTGDLHLGRVSSKCGPEQEETSVFSVRAAWARLVDVAIQQGVQLVLLSGDIADDGSNQYEAMGPFEAGITRLTDHGIYLVLVAGNHDARTLPHLVRVCANPAVHLLGADGTWEAIHWPPEGPSQLTLLGWSYPAGRRVATLPLEALPSLPSATHPVIGMVHTDYRSAVGDYAAVSVSALQRCADIDLWLLGHIHAPEEIGGAPIILNPGSPQALDPGEPGCHGPWLMEITDGTITRIEQLPLSSVIYATVSVDVSEMAEDEELVTRLLPALQPLKDRARQYSSPPRLACRVTLTGRTARMMPLQTDCQRLLQEQPLLDVHQVYLEKITLTEVRPAVDIQALGGRQDAIGALARTLLALETPTATEETTSVLGGAQAMLQTVLASPAVPDDISSDTLPAVESLVRLECGRLLEALLQQEEARA